MQHQQLRFVHKTINANVHDDVSELLEQLLPEWKGKAFTMDVRNIYIYIYIRDCKRRRDRIMPSLNGNIFRVTGPFFANSPVIGEFPSQRPVTRSFDLFSEETVE